MKVIHICGESGVGKNYLLTAIRALETKHNANIELNKFENTFLARFEITNPFTVLKPVKGEVSLVNLRDKIEGLIDKDKHETIIHHWQYSSHRLFYHINRIAPEVRQKIFLLWRDWEYHLEAVS